MKKKPCAIGAIVAKLQMGKQAQKRDVIGPRCAAHSDESTHPEAQAEAGGTAGTGLGKEDGWREGNGPVGQPRWA